MVAVKRPALLTGGLSRASDCAARPGPPKCSYGLDYGLRSVSLRRLRRCSHHRQVRGSVCARSFFLRTASARATMNRWSWSPSSAPPAPGCIDTGACAYGGFQDEETLSQVVVAAVISLAASIWSHRLLDSSGPVSRGSVSPRASGCAQPGSRPRRRGTREGRASGALPRKPFCASCKASTCGILDDNEKMEPVTVSRRHRLPHRKVRSGGPLTFSLNPPEFAFHEVFVLKRRLS